MATIDGLEDKGIAELRSLLDSGQLSVAQLVDAYLGRIEALDRNGPRLNAIIELNPEAREIAAGLDAELRAGSARGPLHGIPILLKDNIDTADRMQTTAGSLALEGHRASLDAGLVARLRDEGALILGKTNLSEWANFRGRRSISGWSSRGGQTRNPHVLDRSPCGSSSGSGVAVAAGLCAAAVGTETDGSIICPAQTNGVVGFKPTLGLVGRSGIIPISASQDTAGPMARSVEDAALLLAAMAGPDPRDAATRGFRAPVSATGGVDYRAFLDPAGLKGAKIGVARKLFGSDPRIRGIAEKAVETMREAGALIREVEIGPSSAFEDAEFEVLLHEFKAGIETYLAGCADVAPRGLADLIAFNASHAEETMPFFGQELFEEAAERGGLDTRLYRRALARSSRLARKRGLAAALRDGDLDCLVFPSGGPAWTVDPVNGDGIRSWDVDSTAHAAVAGFPHITVPAGFIHDLPVGISFVAGPWEEGRLFRVAYAYEGLSRARRSPRFKPSVDAD